MKRRGGRLIHRVAYDDGVDLWHCLAEEKWELGKPPRPKKAKPAPSKGTPAPSASKGKAKPAAKPAVGSKRKR